MHSTVESSERMSFCILYLKTKSICINKMFHSAVMNFCLRKRLKVNKHWSICCWLASKHGDIFKPKYLFILFSLLKIYKLLLIKKIINKILFYLFTTFDFDLKSSLNVRH